MTKYQIICVIRWRSNENCCRRHKLRRALISSFASSTKQSSEDDIKPEIEKIPLIMKSGSDNLIASNIQRLRKQIKAKGIKNPFYEPELNQSEFFNSQACKDLASFKQKSDVIISSQMTPDLKNVKNLYARHLSRKLSYHLKDEYK